MQEKKFSAPAATFQLAAALERYESALSKLSEGWLDAELVRRLHQEFRQLGLLCASLPRLSVSWVAVVVSRARLLQGLTHRSGASASALLDEHLQAVEGLRKRCLRLIGAQTVVLT